MAVPRPRITPGRCSCTRAHPALPSGKGKFFPVEYQPPIEEPDSEYPLVLSTGRTLYHYNSAGMTMREAGITDKQEDPFFEISAEDASALGARATATGCGSSRAAATSRPARSSATASTPVSSGWRSTSPRRRSTGSRTTSATR